MATDDLREAMATVREYWGRKFVDLDKYENACELLARWLVANAGELVRVKGLEWKDRKDASFASTNLFGQFCARPEAWTVPGQPWTKSTSREDAKAKCEAIYADRLAAALAPAFPTKGEQ